MGGGCARWRRRPGALRHRLGSQRPSLRRPGDQHGRQIFRCEGQTGCGRRRLPGDGERFFDWNQDGTMPKEVWGGVGGGYRDAFEEFANGRVVMYLSGSWQIRRLDTQIGEEFDWIVVPNPCGPAACTGMPGGAAFVALKRTKNPEGGRPLPRLARASEPVYAEIHGAHGEHPRAMRGCGERASTTSSRRSRQGGVRAFRDRSRRSSRRSPTRSRATSSTARSSIRRWHGSARRSPARCRSTRP